MISFACIARKYAYLACFKPNTVKLINKIPLIISLLTAHAASGQVGYRSVPNDQPKKKTYDSTVNVENIRCYYDPASMIGQEFYFAQRSPNYKKSYSNPDSTLTAFRSEKETVVKDLGKAALNETVRKAQSTNIRSLGSIGGVANAVRGTAKKSDDLKTYLYKPVYIQHGQYSGEAVTPYSALENKTFTVTGWEVIKEDEHLCQSKVTLKDPDGEKVEWVIYRNLPNVAVFTKGYLEKLKQTWVNKTVYFVTESYAPATFYNPLDKQTLDYVKGSKWECTDLTFLSDEQYFSRLHLILRNDAGKEIAVQIEERGTSERQLSLGYIWPENKYLATVQKEKAEQEALLAKEEAAKQQLQKDVKEYRASMIKQFGATNGNLIAAGKVKLGMTDDMCLAAKGTPDKVVKSQVGADLVESWFYNHNYTSSTLLTFKNGKLIQIVE